MSVQPVHSFSPGQSPSTAPIPLTETEEKTNQLKSLIPINPAEIPLENDRFQIPETHFELFKDLNPDTNELEEGTFLKRINSLTPAWKWEGGEDYHFQSKQGVKKFELFSHEMKQFETWNKYIGYFPKDCTAEDNYRTSGPHVCAGVFDTEGKLLSGIWEYAIDLIGFTLAGEFTYETTETEQRITCKGSYHCFGGNIHGTFVASRQLNEAYYYCTKTEEPEELKETRTDAEGVVQTGVFEGDRLIWGSKTYKSGASVEGLWSYTKEFRGNIITYCQGVCAKTKEQGSFFQGTVLEAGKRRVRADTLVEGRFFSVRPTNPIPTVVTVYTPEKTYNRYTMQGFYYNSREAAKRGPAHSCRL